MCKILAIHQLLSKDIFGSIDTKALGFLSDVYFFPLKGKKTALLK
ncbi:unnamed protein product [Paramecium sonneborni]|uniref:Uncharacterized protein n=1 Tax=Paramecium sonneborni TaxID=65129 RepID=A0A8S1K122_9CILI|nr:unnamed protein product [Paramecium sonneborni]